MVVIVPSGSQYEWDPGVEENGIPPEGKECNHPNNHLGERGHI